MIKLGSHNSWSFGKTKWYIPSFVCRCQNLNIQEQYNKGVRLFDLRIRLDKNEFKAAHGSATFKVNFEKDLEFLKDKDCYVRVMLEYNSCPKNIEKIESLFKEYCQSLESEYPNIKFFSGNRKWDEKNIYQFKNEYPKLLHRYSSTTSWFNSTSKLLRISDDWWPWLYAKFHNKKSLEEFKSNPKDYWLFIDFIEIQ